MFVHKETNRTFQCSCKRKERTLQGSRATMLGFSTVTYPLIVPPKSLSLGYGVTVTDRNCANFVPYAGGGDLEPRYSDIGIRQPARIAIEQYANLRALQ